MLHKANSHNRQVQRTRSWIFEALMLLLNENPYSKISVSDITKKAGIARQTFYRNYDDKDDIAMEYLMNSIKVEPLEIDDGKRGGGQNNIVLVFNYQYMIEHRDNLKKLLSIADIVQRIYHEAQDFPLVLLEQYKNSMPENEYLICRYKLCYQITGCLRVFFDWFINDMPLPLDNMVSMLNAMNIPKTIQYRNIPNIVVRIVEK
jgi:AcrR family transcriptional regulator